MPLWLMLWRWVGLRHARKIAETLISNPFWDFWD
jgi:hypothetical protein